MTSSTPTTAPTDFAAVSGAWLLPWINRGLEGLWLLAVVLVPLAFLGQDYSISEAEIAYVEVPKVALLRMLAGLIVLLWSLEWAIKSRAFQGSFPSVSIQTVAERLRPSKFLLGLIDWLRGHPTRWFVLAAALFFGSTFLSTILSGSFTNSIWGEIPGQDGYSAYTIASYGVLFAVIASHLKTPAQLVRLFGAVVLMGFLVGLYGTLQHYGHDFLNVAETTGGGTTRVTIFMGNTIFAAAVLAMTIPFTLVCSAAHLQNEEWRNWGPFAKIRQLWTDSVITYFWSLILSAQLLGLMFTFSRGSWGGAVLALAVFLSLLTFSLGWRSMIRAGLALGLAGTLSVAFLHSQGSVSIINAGAWLGILLAVLAFSGTVATLFVIDRFRRSIVLIGVVGATIVIVGAVIVGPSALSNRGGTETDPQSGGTGGQVAERILSIRTEVLSGFVGGRDTHWEVSWELIKNRPWFEFDDLSLTWLRPLIGYGPDLFRFTYLLESPANGPNNSPLEPDHAHNFFIHQTVEQGIFGGFASLALFASVFAIAAHQLFRRRRANNPMYRILLFGIMAIVLGRFLEMMVGVARISDLTVLWVVFGLFAATMNFDDGRQDVTAPVTVPSTRDTNRRGRRLAARASKARPFSAGFIFRLAIVAWLAGGIGVVTWQKSINSVRASVAEGRALEHFREGDLDSTLEQLDKAIKLAPGVPSYYNNRAQVFLNYQLRPDIFTHPGCAQQNETPYLTCVGLQSLESNLESVNQQPFYYRSWIASANAAFNLSLHESAVDSYTKAKVLVPNAWPIRNDLAELQINLGLLNEAIAELDRSLEINGDSTDSSFAFYLKAKSLQKLQRFDEALDSINQGFARSYSSVSAQASLDLLREIKADQGVEPSIDYYDELIRGNPEDAVAYYLRGLTSLRIGNESVAHSDIRTAYDLGLRLNETLAHRGYAYFKAGDAGHRARPDLVKAVEVAPENAMYNTYLGEYLMARENPVAALNYLDNAITLDPELGLAHLVRAKIFLTMGLEEPAREALDTLAGLALSAVTEKIDRGELHAFFGEFDLALSDLNESIRLNPIRSESYDARGKTYARMGDFESALLDFDVADQLDSAVPTYLLNRAVLLGMMGETERSLADLRVAESLGVYIDGFSERFVLKAADLTLAVQEDPERARSDVTGGNGFAIVSNPEAAIADFSASIQISPTDPKLFINRGMIYHALGEIERSSTDFDTAKSLGWGDLPRSSPYFAAYVDFTSVEEDARLLSALEAELQALKGRQ